MIYQKLISQNRSEGHTLEDIILYCEKEWGRPRSTLAVSKTSSTRHPSIFLKRRVFLRFTPHINGAPFEQQSQQRLKFSKKVHEALFLIQTPAYRLRVDERKGFLKKTMSYIKNIIYY